MGIWGKIMILAGSTEALQLRVQYIPVQLQAKQILALGMVEGMPKQVCKHVRMAP